jgi:thymidylate synthase (FAD)
LDDGFTEDNRAQAIYMETACKNSFRKYRTLLDWGVPRELARTVLPVATYSEMFATIDLHNLLKFISERTDPGAQYEIRVYAQAMLEMIEPIVPAAVAAWKAHNAVS